MNRKKQKGPGPFPHPFPHLTYRHHRTVPDWTHGRPMLRETQEALLTALEARFPGRVRRSVEVCPLAVNHTIDNEDDAQETLRRLIKARNARDHGEAKGKGE